MVYSYKLDGTKNKEIELPKVFETEFRPDLIKRAVLSARSARIQPWAPNELAGKRTTARYAGKNRGIARTPRVIGGGPMRFHGAYAPNTVGGRPCHPPKVEKVLVEKINKKERKLAIKSAIAATKNIALVRRRNHIIENIPEIPLILEDKVQMIRRTQEMIECFRRFGLWGDVSRSKENKRIKAGRGKLRGRKYTQPKGPLFVISEDKGIFQAARNLAGVSVVSVDKLSAELLAPGADAGRLTLLSESAISDLKKVYM